MTNYKHNVVGAALELVTFLEMPISSIIKTTMVTAMTMPVFMVMTITVVMTMTVTMISDYD